MTQTVLRALETHLLSLALTAEQFLLGSHMNGRSVAMSKGEQYSC